MVMVMGGHNTNVFRLTTQYQTQFTSYTLQANSEKANYDFSNMVYQVSESVFKFVFMHNLRLLFDLPILPKWDPHLVPTCCDWAGHWADHRPDDLTFSWTILPGPTDPD